jgi:hypothetical protein
MHDFKTDAGIAPTPVLAPMPLSTTVPTIQHLNDATIEQAIPEPAASPTELKIQQSIDAPLLQTTPGQGRQRSNKGVPPTRLEPAHHVNRARIKLQMSGWCSIYSHG